MLETSYPNQLATSIRDLRAELGNCLGILTKLEHQLEDFPDSDPTGRLRALAVMVQYVTQLATSNITVRVEVAEAAWHLEQLLSTPLHEARPNC